MSDITEKIGKLLQKAANTDNENERDTFFAHAQRLASTYSVDLEKARQVVAKGMKREEPINKRIQIGEPKKPLNAVFCSLMMEIGRVQDIRFNIAHNSTYVIAFGFPSDIAVMEAMYAHISVQMVTEADAFIRGGTWKGDKTWDARTGWKPTHSRVARRCFYESYISRIGQRMRLEKVKVEAEMQEQDEAEDDYEESTGTAMVLVNKKREIGDYYSAKSTARGAWKGGNNTYTSSSGSSSGRAAGERARLGGQQSISGGRTAIN